MSDGFRPLLSYPPGGQDELYYIISGRAILRVKEEDQPVRPGSIIFVKANVEHHFHSITTLALYELARLEDEAGDMASARQHYQEFLDRWGEADLPIPKVAKAKSHLATLAPQ